MDIQVKFGFRYYIFHSENDVNKAEKLFLKTLENETFENDLEDNNIDFEYAI